MTSRIFGQVLPVGLEAQVQPVGFIDVRTGRSVDLEGRVNAAPAEVDAIQHLVTVFGEYRGRVPIKVEGGSRVSILDTARNPEAGLSTVPNASTNRVALILRIGKSGIREMAGAGYSLPSFLFSLFCPRLRRETAEPTKKIMNNMERRRIYLLASMPIQPIGSTNELHFTAGAVAVSSRKPSEVEREVMGLFEEFRNPLLRYVLSFGIPVHDAEEVVQEVFLALFRHLQLGRSRNNLRGWLFRVGHNLALKQRQTNRRLYEVMAADSAIAEKQCDPTPNPEEQVSFAQRRRRLLAVLNALPEEDQCCLRLRAEGLRYREIAEVLGISLGAVSTSLARSLARFVRAEGS